MKRYAYLFLLALALLVCGACGKSAVSSIPANADEVSAIRAAYFPGWTLENEYEEELSDGLSRGYLYQEPYTNLRLSVNFWVNKAGAKTMKIYLLDLGQYSEYDDNLSGMTPQAFAMAEEMFGQDNQAETIFSRLANELYPEEGDSQASEQNEDLHYILSFTEEDGLALSMEIANDSYFQNYDLI